MAENTMKAAVLTGPRQIEIKREPLSMLFLTETPFVSI